MLKMFLMQFKIINIKIWTLNFSNFKDYNKSMWFSLKLITETCDYHNNYIYASEFSAKTIDYPNHPTFELIYVNHKPN